MVARHPLIVANWKMHTNYAEATILATLIKNGLSDIHHVEVVICPPHPWLVPIAELYKRHPLPHLQLGAQNIWSVTDSETEGAYTGEVSAKMIKGLVSHVIVGHSERVKFFHETPVILGQKILAALDAGITPIVCVGELHRSPNLTDQVIKTLQEILKPVTPRQWSELVIAYEPVWAISTNFSSEHGPASGDDAQRVAQAIRDIVGSQTPILYGGSVDSANIAEFLHQDEIDGALVGAASLKAKEFLKICEVASGIRK